MFPIVVSCDPHLSCVKEKIFVNSNAVDIFCEISQTVLTPLVILKFGPDFLGSWIR